MDMNKLLGSINNVIQRYAGEMEIITSGLAWEKWFQCHLYAELIVNDVEVYGEACMDDSIKSAGLRSDLMVVNGSQEPISLLELKCASPNMHVNAAVAGFHEDLGKQDESFAAYDRVCILLYRIDRVSERERAEIHGRTEALCSEKGWQMHADGIGVYGIIIAVKGPQ